MLAKRPSSLATKLTRRRALSRPPEPALAAAIAAPLACAVGNAVLDVILADGFLARVEGLGIALKQKLARLKDEHPLIVEDVRGMGLMMGIKCKTPNTELQSAAHEERLLTLTAGDNIVRLLPPLIVSDEDLSEGVERLDRACRRLEATRV